MSAFINSLTNYIAIILARKNFWRRSVKIIKMLNSSFFNTKFYNTTIHKTMLHLRFKIDIVRYINNADKSKPSPHKFFDHQFYYNKYSDVENNKTAAITHYINHGFFELRDPHPFIDITYINKHTKLSDIRSLTEYLLANAGTGSSHPEIDENYVVKQLSSKQICRSDLLSLFLDPANRHLDPSKKFKSLSSNISERWYQDFHPFYAYLRFFDLFHEKSLHKLMLRPLIAQQLEQIASIEPEINNQLMDYSHPMVVRYILNARFHSLLLQDLLQSSPTSAKNIIIVDLDETGILDFTVSNLIPCLSLEKESCLIINLADKKKKIHNNQDVAYQIMYLKSYFSSLTELDILRELTIFCEISMTENIYSVNSEIGLKLFERSAPILAGNTKFHIVTFLAKSKEFAISEL